MVWADPWQSVIDGAHQSNQPIDDTPSKKKIGPSVDSSSHESRLATTISSPLLSTKRVDSQVAARRQARSGLVNRRQRESRSINQSSQPIEMTGTPPHLHTK